MTVLRNIYRYAWHVVSSGRAISNQEYFSMMVLVVMPLWAVLLIVSWLVSFIAPRHDLYALVSRNELLFIGLLVAVSYMVTIRVRNEYHDSTKSNPLPPVSTKDYLKVFGLGVCHLFVLLVVATLTR